MLGFGVAGINLVDMQQKVGRVVDEVRSGSKADAPKSPSKLHT